MPQERNPQADFMTGESEAAVHDTDASRAALFGEPSGIPLDAFWAILDPEDGAGQAI